MTSAWVGGPHSCDRPILRFNEGSVLPFVLGSTYLTRGRSSVNFIGEMPYIKRNYYNHINMFYNICVHYKYICVHY